MDTTSGASKQNKKKPLQTWSENGLTKWARKNVQNIHALHNLTPTDLCSECKTTNQRTGVTTLPVLQCKAVLVMAGEEVEVVLVVVVVLVEVTGNYKYK